MRRTAQRLRILVVDDEEDMCWALQRILETEGHAATIARTAKEALRLARHEAFDLAFLDVKLPDMDGLDLAARLRTVSPRMPCTLLSGYLYHDDVSVQAGLSEGLIHHFIGKPFLLSEIRDALRLAADPT